MSEPHFINPPEMEKLLAKYRSGNVPPLVAKGSEGDGGLIEEGLMEILREGFSVKYSIPYISIISANHKESHTPTAVEAPSDQQLRDLIASCKYFQSSGDARSESPGNALCERCSMITQDTRARACMRYCGMVSFFAPVYVAGEVVAFLLAECKKPKAKAMWPRKLIEQISFAGSSSAPSGEVDLWQESGRRIRECEEKLNLKSGELLKKIIEGAEIDPTIEASPEEFEAIISALEKAGRYLSDLADRAYKLEKESVIGWTRAEMASALSAPDSFWEKIQWCFGNLAQLVGSDYILLISPGKSGANNNGSLHLQCQHGLPGEFLPAIQYDWEGSTAHVGDLVKRIGTLKDAQEINLREYRDVPVLGMLYSLYGRGVSYPVLVVPANTLDGSPTFMILGKRAPEASMDSYSPGVEWLREDDRQHLMTIARELAIITNVFFSMNKIQETLEDHSNFMESVSHDLRTPIQNIMIAAENLREFRIPPERASRTITGVVTQLERLNLLAQKAWMLEQIRADRLVYNDEQTVSPYSISLECRNVLIDLADGKNINIHIDPGMKNWREIHVDAEIFRLVVLNLLQNGIKYSFPNTHIRVGGWQDGAGIGVAMTFENEGISIRDEERDRIFERYFRSKDAVKIAPDGSGIGLALVKEFVDHYRGKVDVRSNEVGFGRYLNVFSLFLPGR